MPAMPTHSQDHRSGLDSLRGLLAIIVVAAHTWQTFIRPLESGGPASLSSTVLGLSARIAVLAFFCLSGFVIAMSISSNTARHGDFRLAKFGESRFFRIVPPLLLVIFAVLAIQVGLTIAGLDRVNSKFAAREVYETDVRAQMTALITLCLDGELTGNWLNGPLWSLAYEIKAYVLAGLGAAILLGRGRIRGWAAVALLSYAWVLFDEPFNRLQVLCFTAFGLGVLAYLCREVDRKALAIVGLVAAASALAAYGSAPIKSIRLIDFSPYLLSAQAAVAVLLSIVVLLVARGPAWRFLGDSGAYSYTLYIGHFPVLLLIYFLLAHLLPAALAGIAVYFTAAAAMTGTLALLALVGRAIEHPAAQKKWLTSLRITARLPNSPLDRTTQ